MGYAVGRGTTVVALALVACLWGCGGDDTAPEDAGVETRDAGARDAGPPLDDSPFKGPWVLRLGQDTATVRWESRLPPETVAVEHEPEDGGLMLTAEGASTGSMITTEYAPSFLEEPDLAGTYYLNEVAISGLQPATCYQYALVGYPEHAGRFCTLHAPDDHTTPIRIYVIGDTNPALLRTANILSNVDPTDAELILHAGDLQYYSSIVESWQLWFRMMAPLLEANAFLPCVGNHEMELDGEYEDYFERLFGNAGIDGTTIRYHFQSGGVHFFALSTEHDLGPESEQYRWFTETLESVESEPTYRFSIVYLHRPLYTLADARPRLRERETLEPVFRAHRVPLILAGHVHGYERFEVDDLTYITTGGGGAIRSDVDENVGDYPEDAARRMASGDFYHAMFIDIEGDTIRGTAVDETGAVRDSFEKTVAPR